LKMFDAVDGFLEVSWGASQIDLLRRGRSWKFPAQDAVRKP